MRFAQARPLAVTLAVGGVLLATATGFEVAAAVSATAAQVGQADAAAMLPATASGSAAACEPLRLPTPTPSPSPSPTPTNTPTQTPSPTATPTPTHSTPTPSTTTNAPSPSKSTTGTPSPSNSTSNTTSGTPTPTPASSNTPTASKSATASASATASPAPSGGTATPSTSAKAARQGVLLAVTKAAKPVQVSLCVAISRSQPSRGRGQPALWIVSAWTLGGNVPDAIIRLQASPSRVTPEFSFGCGSHDGTGSCDLGAVDAKSAARQLQARATVPVSARSVTSVRLTVIGSAAHLPKEPAAAVAVTITAPPPGTPTPSTSPIPATSPLPVGTLPDIPAANPTLSPGGNAGDLFPTLDPAKSKTTTHTRQVANTSALPGGASVIGAQLVGLGALGLAFVLAVTRLSIRRRPVPAAPPAEKPADPGGTAGDKESGAPAADEAQEGENAPEE